MTPCGPRLLLQIAADVPPSGKDNLKVLKALLPILFELCSASGTAQEKIEAVLASAASIGVVVQPSAEGASTRANLTKAVEAAEPEVVAVQ